MTQETQTLEQTQTVTVTKGEFHDEQGYWIVRGCQTAFFQRKDVFHATDNSLSAVERDTIALCETVLHLERRLQEAERELDDYRATLKDERYCHGQTIAQLKNAASEEIQQQVERADKCSQIAHEEIAQRCKAEARAEAMAGSLRDCVERMERARGILTDGKNDCWSMLDTEQARAALSHPLGGKT